MKPSRKLVIGIALAANLATVFAVAKVPRLLAGALFPAEGGSPMPAITKAPTPTELVEALTAAGGDLDDQDRQIALATFRLLAEGRPIRDSQVAAAADTTLDAVAARLAEWPGVFRNHDDEIVGFQGLAVHPLDPEYRLRAADGSAVGYAWCAWDTLFLPAVLGQTLEVTASDGQTGESIRLEVAPDGVRRSQPSEAVVSFAVPDAAWDANVMTSFCHKVLFFANQDNAKQWIAAHRDELMTLSVEDAFEVGRLWIRARYGDALDLVAAIDATPAS